MATTVRVQQASQPTFFGVSVGVMIAGLKDGVPTTRLAVRSDTEGKRVDLEEGESTDLFGRGTVTVVEVHPRKVKEQRDEVTLRFTGADESES